MLIKNRAASSAKKINPTLLLDSVKQPQLISSPLTTAKTAPKLKTQINKNMIILPLWVLKPFNNNNPATSSTHGSIMATKFVNLTGTSW
jgi:hypothetical protein